MTHQLDLFDPHRLARRTDPATSHAAAEQAETLTQDHEHRILICLREVGSPMTADQIAERTGLLSVQVSRRMAALRDEVKVVVAVGVGKTRSGRMATTWGLA